MSPTLVVKRPTPVEMKLEVARMVLLFDVDQRVVEPVVQLVEVARTDFAEVAGL